MPVPQSGTAFRMASQLLPLFLLLLTLRCSLAAPVESPATENPFLEGLDDFLAAFDGLSLGGDPMATPEPAATDGETTETTEPEVVTEVRQRPVPSLVQSL